MSVSDRKRGSGRLVSSAGRRLALRSGAAALAAVLAAGAAPLAAAGQEDPPRPRGDQQAIVLLFDSSGSMRADDGSGSRRIDTAKAAITSLIDGAPADARIGLRVFGGRFGDKQKRLGCRDSRALFGVGPVDKAATKRAIARYRPTGFTPIGLSLRRAVQDLPSSGRRTIILVSDGQETCGPPPPCKVAREVARSGVELKIQAIGFQVNRRSRRQLQCIARAGNGVYRDVQDAPRLAEELRALSARALRDYDAQGTPIEGGPTARQATEVGPGQYLDRIGPDEERWYAIDLDERETLQAATALVPEERFGLEAVGADFTIDIVNDRFEEVGTNNSGATTGVTLFDSDTEGGIDSIGVVGRPVAVGDQASTDAADAPFGRPGRYHLRVRLSDNDSKDLFTKLDGRPVELELLVNVLGREGGQAKPPDGDGVGAALDPGDPTEAGAAGGSDGEGPTALALALVSLLALAAGIAGAAGLMRSRRPA